MKMKIKDLSVELLNDAVLMFERPDLVISPDKNWWWTNAGQPVCRRGEHPLGDWSGPADDWSIGGPIIERERIDLMAWNQREDGVWFSCLGFVHDTPGWDADGGNDMKGEGPTPLIAAMRAFVSSKWGEEIEVPE